MNLEDSNAESVINESFNPTQPFSFFLTIDEWLRMKPKENAHFNSDGRRPLQPGWTDIFESKLRRVNPNCIRWYAGSAKKWSSRKQTAAYFTGRATCKNPECTLSYRLIIEQEPAAQTKEVEVTVTPQGQFTPTDPLDVQHWLENRSARKRDYFKMMSDDAELFDGNVSDSFADEQNPPLLDYGGAASCDYAPGSIISRRFPPYIRYGKRHVGGSSNVLVGCGGGKTMEDVLYCSTLEADKAKLLAEKEKLDAETIMLRAKTEELVAKKAKLEIEMNNLLIHRVKLKHELNAIGLNVEIVMDDPQYMTSSHDDVVEDQHR